MKNQKYIIIGLLSLSLIGMELIWTRIFSSEFFYTFSFLILSLAILGLSMGSLSLRLFKKLNNEKLLSSMLGLSAIFSIISPVLVFKMNLDMNLIFSDILVVFKLLATITLLSSSFFFGGMALGLLFKTNVKNLPRLYMYDLVGAGLSVLLSIILMNVFGTQNATFLISIPLIIAAFLSVGKKYIPIVAIVLIAVFFTKADQLLESDRTERAPVIYKHWDAMAKVKVYGYNEFYRGINIDNMANSPIYGFDGNYQDTNLQGWDIDVKNLIDQFDSCKFLSMGAGGGGDVLQALAYGASEVHAIEVNAHINKMMTEGDLKGYIIPDSIENKEDFEIMTSNKFSGNIYNNEKVKVVSEDARTYIKRYTNKFDIIYSLSSNTWAALGSGSFAFAENYLFTVEAFKDYWNALSENGYMSMDHQMYMPRIVSAVMEALTQMGIEHPEKHIAIYKIPQMRRSLMLLSKQPLSTEMVNRAYGRLQNGTYNSKEILHPLPADSSANLISNIVTEGWLNYEKDAKTDISPSTDNDPFIAQLGLWRNFSFEKLKTINVMSDFQGFPLTKALLVIIILIILLFAIPLVFLPILSNKTKLKTAPWLYFFTLGMGYIIIEIVLMQKYSLFIGASFYSIATVLLTLLVSSGIGSRYSKRFSNKFIFIGIAILVLLNILLFNGIINVFSGLPIFLRSLVTALVIFPLGFLMGMPFPKGGLKVGELIDWGFALNGIASVLGSTFIMLVVFAYGFNFALIVAVSIYLVAYALISRPKAW